MLGFSNEEQLPALGAVSTQTNKWNTLIDKLPINKEFVTTTISPSDFKYEVIGSGGSSSISNPITVKEPFLHIDPSSEIRPGVTYEQLREEQARLFPDSCYLDYRVMPGYNNKHSYQVASIRDMNNISQEFTTKYLGFQMSIGDICIVSNNKDETKCYIYDGKYWILLGAEASASSYVEECDVHDKELCCVVQAKYDLGYENGQDDYAEMIGSDPVGNGFLYVIVNGVQIYTIDNTDDLKNYSDAPIGSVAIKNTVRDGGRTASNTIWKKIGRGWVMSLCDKDDAGI